MNTPIKREDIRKGDRVKVAYEYTALGDKYGPIDMTDVAYELIERPVQLPIEAGTVLRWNSSDGHGERTAVRRNHNNPGWHYQGPSRRNGNSRSSHEYDDGELLGEIGTAAFVVLRPVAEVAAEVLAEVLAEFASPHSSTSFFGDVQTVADKYGVTL